MTSGMLKLMSLLLVIAAGGGVAWRAQQGLLQTGNASSETGSDETGADDETLAEFEETSTETLDIRRESDDDSPPSLTASDWDTEKEAGRPARHEMAAEKYERKSRVKPLEEPIRPREQLLPTGSNEDSLSESDPGDEMRDEPAPTGVDPFAEEKNAPLANGSDGPALLPTPIQQPEEEEKSDVAANDPFSGGADPEEKSDAAPAEMERDALEESSPVRLAGHDEESDGKGRVKLANDRDLAEEEPTESDPFSGSAPPEFSSEEMKDGENSAEMSNETETEKDIDPFAGAEEPEPAKQSRGGKLPSKLIEDVEELAKEPENTEFEPDSGRSSKRREMKSESVREESRDAFHGEAIPSRRPLKVESPESEPLPQLQPVPESPRGLMPVADEPAERRPARSETLIDEPRDGLSRLPLNGDGVAEQDAPRGLQQPRLSIEKIAPKQAVLKQPFVYSVLVKNTGSADAHQVTVEDRIPKGTVLEGTSPRAELIDKRLVWRLGTLRPDEQKKISIKVIPQEPGPIGSVAKVNFVAEVAAEIEVTAPQVVLSISSPSQVRLGDKLQMVFRVRNAGRADASNVIVRNLIPEGLRHPAGADLEYAVGTLPAQESREIKLDLVATKNGKVSNKTLITADGGVNVEEETGVEVIGEQLLLTRTGKTKLFIDRPAVFTSTVANEGTASAAKVQVAEVVPAGFEFVAASDQGKFDPATRAVTWTVGPIPPGEEIKLSTKLMPKNAGDYHATVTVTGPAGSVANVDAELKVNGFPAMAVDSKSDTRLIAVGEKATIRIQFKNQGTATAKNVILSAELPPELQLVNGKGPVAWGQEGNLVAFEALESLEPQETAAYELQVEGVTEGDSRIELKISADHLTRPLHRDETLRVTPDSE